MRSCLHLSGCVFPIFTLCVCVCGCGCSTVLSGSIRKSLSILRAPVAVNNSPDPTDMKQTYLQKSDTTVQKTKSTLYITDTRYKKKTNRFFLLFLFLSAPHWSRHVDRTVNAEQIPQLVGVGLQRNHM